MCVCELLPDQIFHIYIWKIKCVEKVILLYIFLDNVSCEEFAM